MNTDVLANYPPSVFVARMENMWREIQGRLSPILQSRGEKLGRELSDLAQRVCNPAGDFHSVRDRVEKWLEGWQMFTRGWPRAGWLLDADMQCEDMKEALLEKLRLARKRQRR